MQRLHARALCFDVRRFAVAADRFGRRRADRREQRLRIHGGPLLGRQLREEVVDRRGARERDDVDLLLDDEGAELFDVVVRRIRLVCDREIDGAAALAQLFDQLFAPFRGADDRGADALLVHREQRQQRDRLELVGNEIGVDAAALQLGSRRVADGGNLAAGQRACVLPCREQAIEERLHAVRRREDDPLIGGEIVHYGVERLPGIRRADFDGRELQHLSARLFEQALQIRGLLARAGDDDALAEQRFGLEPVDDLVFLDDVADDDQCRRREVGRGDLRLDGRQRSGDGALFARRRFGDDGDRFLRRHAVGQLTDDRRQVREAHQEHDRSA